jgi:hypothetical protein
MGRVYVVGCRDRERVGMRTPVDVYLTFRAEEAHSSRSREEAQRQCPIFDDYRVRVSWTEDGEEYVCKFQVEEHSPQAFLLFCDGPFVFRATGSKAITS